MDSLSRLVELTDDKAFLCALEDELLPEDPDEIERLERAAQVALKICLFSKVFCSAGYLGVLDRLSAQNVNVADALEDIGAGDLAARLAEIQVTLLNIKLPTQDGMSEVDFDERFEVARRATLTDWQRAQELPGLLRQFLVDKASQ
jgi:hypothetical protein